MGRDNLERLGILLMFFSGVLLAPEIIGQRNIDRINRFLSKVDGKQTEIVSVLTLGGDYQSIRSRRARRRSWLSLGIAVFLVAGAVYMTHEKWWVLLVLSVQLSLTFYVSWCIFTATWHDSTARSSESGLDRNQLRVITAISLLVYVLLFLGWFPIGVALWILVGAFYVALDLTGVKGGFVDSSVPKLERFTRAGFMFVTLPALLGYLIFASVFSLTLDTIGWASKLVDISLGKARWILLWTGMAFFIVGTCVQFAATYF